MRGLGTSGIGCARTFAVLDADSSSVREQIASGSLFTECRERGVAQNRCFWKRLEICNVVFESSRVRAIDAVAWGGLAGSPTDVTDATSLQARSSDTTVAADAIAESA